MKNNFFTCSLGSRTVRIRGYGLCNALFTSLVFVKSLRTVMDSQLFLFQFLTTVHAVVSNSSFWQCLKEKATKKNYDKNKQWSQLSTLKSTNWRMLDPQSMTSAVKEDVNRRRCKQSFQFEPLFLRPMFAQYFFESLFSCLSLSVFSQNHSFWNWSRL